MSRPRKPTSVLNAAGAFRKNPQRKRDGEPETTGPIGTPRESLSTTEVECWQEIVDCAPLGVLTRSDRIFVEIVAGLMAEMRADFEGMQTSRLALLVTMLGKAGLNPSDRARLSIPTAKEDNPFSLL